MEKKSKSIVVPAQEGAAFWQPGVKGNCITIKVSPWNTENINHTVFLHEMPKDGEIGEHAHEQDEEIFICLEGEAIITIDGEEFSLKQHDIAYVAPLCKHSIRSISDTPLKLMVVVSPSGLEERLKIMGIAKKALTETPPEAFISDISNQNTHGVI